VAGEGADLALGGVGDDGDEVLADVAVRGEGVQAGDEDVDVLVGWL